MAFRGLVNLLKLNAYAFSWAGAIFVIRFSKGFKIDERLRTTVSEATMKVPFFVCVEFGLCMCVYIWFRNVWDSFIGVSLWVVFLDGEPIWSWIISGYSILYCIWLGFVESCFIEIQWWLSLQDDVRMRKELGKKKGRGKLSTQHSQSLLYLSLNMCEVIDFLVVKITVSIHLPENTCVQRACGEDWGLPSWLQA